MKLIWFLCCCVFSGSEAFGRFDEIDADVIDQEERLSAASFHDANTYRFYPRFEKLWLSKDIGYRISDGSYDADRSRIHEQIKVSTPPEDTLRFSYARDHYHDLMDRISNDEIRLTWKPVWGLYIAGLADGTSSYKQWGDLGAAFGWMRDRSSINRELRDEDIAGKSDVNIDLFKERFLDEASIEQKFQFAFELHLKENFWVFLNATLDVDGIRREFPYRESPTPGEIWDGGGVQLMAVF